MAWRASAILAVSAGVTWAAPERASSEGFEVFEPVHAAELDNAADGFTVKRSRLVTVDRGLLFGAAAERGGEARDRVVFTAFEDARFHAARDATDVGLGATPVWFGRLEDEREGYALVVMHGEAVAGKIFSPRRGTFEILPAGAGLVSVREIDLARQPPCGVDHRHEDVHVPGHRVDDQPLAPAERGGERGGFIFVDVGILYTAATRGTLGGTAETEAFLDAAIADSNVAYMNSEVNIRLRSAFKAETGYTQAADLGTDLSALQGTTDGLMNEAHTLRNLYGADIVSLIVNSATNACGVGYLMTSVGPSFDSLAFNVTARSCVSGLTFPHELGHNMGCAHDRDNAGGASYSYAYGYRTPGNQWRTVMAYAPGTRIPYFSNPNVTFGGFPLGVPIGQAGPCFNALALNNNAPTIAAWRTLFTQPPGTFSLQSPADGATTADRTPDFAWDAAADTDYYRLEVDNDPGFSSPEMLIEPITTNSFASPAVPPITLAPGVTYSWRVTAVNPLGSRGSSPISRTFSTPASPPASFALAYPGEGTTGVSRNPSFTWQMSNDADGYSLQVDNDPGFGSPEISVPALTGNAYAWLGAPLTPVSQYFWRVSSSNAIGSTSSSPASASFTTIGVAPDPFALLSPADGENVATLTPTLSWASAPFATDYRLIVDDDLGLASPALDQAGLTGTTLMIPPGTLANGVRYYWQVRAGNATGTTNSTPGVATFGVVVPACQGDANGDFIVNFSDISSILSNWGGAGPAGDANHDGAVNFIDVSAVLSAWGAPC
jgi:hypothetical protein